MPKALLLGSGLVAGPLVSYLLDKKIELTIASLEKERAEKLIGNNPLGRALHFSVEDRETLRKLIREHDLTISLLPATMHTIVAEICVAEKKHMATASYVSPAMRELETRARQAGVVMLNELGVDPGIDHMSAMKIIHQVQSESGRVTDFRSYCGGIPSPEANDNPWGYKFSWSPVGVLRAATNSAHYLKNGREVILEPQHLFFDVHHLDIEGVGELEAYPNRDSMSYISLYGLEGIKTMFRGTLRYKGWSETMRGLRELGFLSTEEQKGLGGLTWAQFVARMIGAPDTHGLKERVAAYLWTSPQNETIKRFKWLGLFSNHLLPADHGSPLELLAQTMMEKMMYDEGEQDLIVMHHEFIAEYGTRRERITSTLIDYGIEGGETSMARTVSLPLAIAVRMVLEGKFREPGVHIPTRPDLYRPILDELATLNIAMRESKSEC